MLAPQPQPGGRRAGRKAVSYKERDSLESFGGGEKLLVAGGTFIVGFFDAHVGHRRRLELLQNLQTPPSAGSAQLV